MTVVVSRHGAVEVRTPGGVCCAGNCRRAGGNRSAVATGPLDAAVGGGRRRTVLRARRAGVGAPAARRHVPPVEHRPGRALRPGRRSAVAITMPRAAGGGRRRHASGRSTTTPGTAGDAAEGEEGAGSGHDRPGSVRAADGRRAAALLGDGGHTRARAARLGRADRAPALPPAWALGPPHGSGAGRGAERRSAGAVSRATATGSAGCRALAPGRRTWLPLSGPSRHRSPRRHRVFTVDGDRFPGLPGLAEELRQDGIRLVSVVDPAVQAEPGNAVYDSGCGRRTSSFGTRRGGRCGARRRPGSAVFPDFTHARVRAWWGGLYEERLGQGFAGVMARHGRTGLPSPLSASRRCPVRRGTHWRAAGGDHREAHNVYALTHGPGGLRGAAEAAPRRAPVLLSRSGWAGMQRYGGSWSAEVARAGRGCGLRCRWSWGWGCAGCPTRGRMSAVSAVFGAAGG